MLEGKILRGLTGIPMRNTALANIRLALEEPVPLILANFTTKSFTPLTATGDFLLRDVLFTLCFIMNACPITGSLLLHRCKRIFPWPMRRWGTVLHIDRSANIPLHLFPSPDRFLNLPIYTGVVPDYWRAGSGAG